MREGIANGKKWPNRANSDGVALDEHTHVEGDRRGLPTGGSLRSDSAGAASKPRRSPSGRLRTETGREAGTETRSTETGNGEAPTVFAATPDRGRPSGAIPSGEQETAREKRQPRSVWELRELILPLAVRRRGSGERRRRVSGGERVFDPALVEWVYESRLAIVSQLQRRFPDSLPSQRTAQRHVARLVDAGYLAATTVRSTGPHFPRVLHATGRGLRLVRGAYARLGREWDGPVTEDGKAHGLALDSVLHEILLTEFDLTLYRTVAERPDLTWLQRERRYFRRDRQLTYSEWGRTRRVVPDAGYLIAAETPAGRQLLPQMFLELENGTHSVAKIRDKLDRYRRWSEQEAGEYLQQLYSPHGEPHKSSFRLLLIAHDKHGTVSDDRRLVDLLVQAIELPRRLRDALWFTTAAALRQYAGDPAPLSAPIWIRAKSLNGRGDHLGRLPSKSDPTRITRQRSFLTERLLKLPRHPLLSHPDSLSDAQN